MAVISISITESTEEVVNNIPRYITISVNISSVIFYTFNGEEPTVSSSVYVDGSKLGLPTDKPSFTLKILATNGSDTGTFDKEYASVIDQDNLRKSHSAVSAPGNNGNSLIPFGSNYPEINKYHWNGENNVGETLNKPGVAEQDLGGYDGQGGRVGGTDLPYTLENYNIIYSTTNNIGEPLPTAGTLPAKTTVIGKEYPVEYTPEYSSTADKIFHPRALVIYHDVDAESLNDPPIIQRAYFSLQNSEIYNNGNNKFVTGPDTMTFTGTYVKSFYNERTQKMTYYYYDNSVGRWIISEFTYVQTEPTIKPYLGMAFGRGGAAVKPWRLFQGTYLY